jgi:hypothetical protein
MGATTGVFRPLPPIPVHAGQVLEMPAGSRKWMPESVPLPVTAIRPEISGLWDGEWVWVEGNQLDGADVEVRWTQELVLVAPAVSGRHRRGPRPETRDLISSA